MKDRLTDAQIDAAVKWWRETLEGPPQHDNLSDAEKDTATPVDLAYSAHARLAAKEHRPTTEKIEKFCTELRQRLSLAAPYNARLKVDYQPFGLLSEVADAAGIDECVFPCKTVMNFYDDGALEVKCGYGRPFEPLLPGHPSCQ